MHQERMQPRTTHSLLAIEMYSGYLMRVMTRSKLMAYSRNPRGCRTTWTSWCWMRTIRLFLTSLIGLRVLWQMNMSGLGPLMNRHFPTSPMTDPKCCERRMCKRLASTDMARQCWVQCWVNTPVRSVSAVLMNESTRCRFVLNVPSTTFDVFELWTFTGHSSSSITTCHHDPRFSLSNCSLKVIQSMNWTNSHEISCDIHFKEDRVFGQKFRKKETENERNQAKEIWEVKSLSDVWLFSWIYNSNLFYTIFYVVRWSYSIVCVHCELVRRNEVTWKGREGWR